MFGPGAVGWLGLFRSIAEGSFRMLGSGDGLYQAGDVEDVAGLARCGEVPGIEGRVYHLTGAEPVRLAEIVSMIAEEVDGPPMPRPFPAAPLHAYRDLQRVVMRFSGRSLPRFGRVEFFLGDRVFDISRARRELGYTPEIDLRSSIERTATWFREQGLLPAPDRGRDYIRLP